jgi:MarR family transcriptional regulator, transcriptional regulator for hemolysin
LHYQPLIYQMNIEQVILFQIDKTSKVAKMYSQKEFDRLGLNITVDQWVLLKIIHERKEISQNELAEFSFRDPASITRTLDLLDKKELIERQAIPNNRRQYNILLTKSGLAFVKKHLQLINALRAKSIEGLSNKEIKMLTYLLQKIEQNMR